MEKLIGQEAFYLNMRKKLFITFLCNNSYKSIENTGMININKQSLDNEILMTNKTRQQIYAN